MRSIGTRKIAFQRDDLTLWRRASLFAVEEGVAAAAMPVTGSKYPYSGRVLGSMVNDDPFHMLYTDAALVTLTHLQPRFDAAQGLDTVTASVLGGFDGLLASVVEVGAVALQESYRVKYSTLKLRPQYAHRIDLAGRLNATHPSALHTVSAHMYATPERVAFMERLRSGKPCTRESATICCRRTTHRRATRRTRTGTRASPGRA